MDVLHFTRGHCFRWQEAKESAFPERADGFT